MEIAVAISGHIDHLSVMDMVTEQQSVEKRPKSPLSLVRRVKRGNWLFYLTVVAPTTIAVLYYGLLASPVYVSESRFVVRSPDKPSATGLGVILKGAGFANANDEAFVVKSFVTSRNALRRLNAKDQYKKAYSTPDIGLLDRFNPTGLFGSFEHLYEYYGKRVELATDSTSSISTLTVRAYDPESARKFNEQLLEMSEQMVNRLNVRGRQDLIQFAQAEVDRARVEALRTSQAVAGYRNRSGVVDPEKQAQVQMQMVSKLQDELIAARAALAQVQSAAPQNPQIPALRVQIGTLERAIATETSKVVGSGRSLAASAAGYEQLRVQSEVAQKQLGSALASLEQARNEALRKQAYVERVVQPDLPDFPQEPRRLRGIFATLMLSLVVFGILRMLLAGVREHGQ